MDPVSSATPECWGSTRQAKHHNRSVLAAASCVLAIFRPSDFIPHNFRESTTKPQPEPQTCSPPEGAVRSGRALEMVLVGSPGLGPLGRLATLPDPSGKERRGTYRCKRTLQKGHGVPTLLEAC